MCWDDRMRPREWSLVGLGGSGACEGSVNPSVNPLHKIGLPIQYVTIIIFFYMVYAAFPFRLLTLYLHFISKFLFYVSCVSVRHCAGKLQIQSESTSRKNPLTHLQSLTTLFTSCIMCVPYIGGVQYIWGIP